MIIRFVFHFPTHRVFFFLIHREMDRKNGMCFLHCPDVTDRYLISGPQTKNQLQTKKNPNKAKNNPTLSRNFSRVGFSASRRNRKASEKVQREAESGESWLGISVMAKQKESLKRKKKRVRLLGNGKEDKKGKFPQKNNCKQKINQSMKPCKE